MVIDGNGADGATRATWPVGAGLRYALVDPHYYLPRMVGTVIIMPSDRAYRFYASHWACPS